MTSTYLPPVPHSWGLDDRTIAEVIESGPTFIRTRLSTRWHRVRSGVRWMAEWDPDTIRENYTAWCGPAVGNNKSGPPIFSDNPPHGDPLCGPCEGRFIGADSTRPEWLFLPRSLKVPKLCPGSRTMTVLEDQNAWNRATCLFCGEVVKLRGYGGWYGGLYGAQRHEPGPGLVKPCQLHGWDHLRRTTDNTLICRCEVTR